MSLRADHRPTGNPCACGLDASAHRVEHIFVGNPKRDKRCRYCKLAPEQHRAPRKRAPKKYAHRYVGIDGEGQGRDDHRYVILARSDPSGRYTDLIEAPPGERLSTQQCLDFILRISPKSHIFAFAFNYDLTHILRDLPDRALYWLFRPELRVPPNAAELPKRQRGPRPIKWRGYSINLISRKFVVQRGKRRRVIWDIFAFFQSKFTTALELWKVGTPEELREMARMKSLRSEFDRQSPDEVKRYCLSECQKMAALAKKLVAAHNDAGLTLRAYFGAGSTASALLKQWETDKQTRYGPNEIEKPVAAAFFGGRFECSRLGRIPGPVYGYDISSAYPYQITFLPCLECGEWSHTYDESEAREATVSLIRHSVKKVRTAWAPFPFRSEDGSICYPSSCSSGWVWSDEFFTAQRIWPENVRFHEAWTYRTKCEHRPFAEVPSVYLERLKLGKEGPGIVLKLGANSIYGKLAQSIGVEPPFQSWIWAGMITSGTRAQLLDLMARHRAMDSVIMVATDGLYSTEDVTPPAPRDTGTMTAHGKPLGGWERTIAPNGMFSVRPGVYFPLGLTSDDLAKVRARGVGRAAMLAQWQAVIDAYESGAESVKVANVARFHGAKNTVSFGKNTGYKRSKLYGQWDEKEIILSFDPMPKRASRRRDGTLVLRTRAGLTSEPYDPALKSLEGIMLEALALELADQPDGADFSELLEFDG